MTEHVETPTEERSIYELFRWSVLLKGAISVIEVVSGIALTLIPVALIIAGFSFFTGFLPASALTRMLAKEVAAYTDNTQDFVALYLFSRGIIKVFLIWALLKGKLWAYPSSLIVLALFVLYQLYQILTTHSVLVVLITIFDLVVIYFIWREWRIVERHKKEGTLVAG